MNPIETVTLEPRTLVGIRRKVPVDALQPYFAEVLPRVMGWLTHNKVKPASMPVAVWHGMNPETGVADVQAGAFVPKAIESDGDITPATTPGGEALKLVHVGPYAKMSASWGRVFEHAKSLGKTPGLGWEIYVDDPGEVDESELKTEIYLSIS